MPPPSLPLLSPSPPLPRSSQSTRLDPLYMQDLFLAVYIYSHTHNFTSDYHDFRFFFPRDYCPDYLTISVKCT